MKLTVTPYNIPFKKPLVMAKGVINNREGLWIRCKSDTDYYGEAAPLPGFSVETLDETKQFFGNNQQRCLSYLREGLSLNPKLEINEVIGCLRSLSEIWSGNPPPSSALFALDTILLQRWSMQYKPAECKPIALNALISSESDVNEAVKQGFKTIKMKIGVDTPQELELLKWIRINWPDLRLRLDANEAWSSEQAQENLPLYVDFSPEYIEEPFQNIHDSSRIHDAVNVAIGADESARNIADVSRLIDNNSCDVFILKPMLCNGIENTLRSIRLSVANQKKVVITSSLDSGLARRAYALIASLYLAQETHGLATGKLLTDDPWCDDILIHDGKYHVEPLFRKP